MTNFEFGDQPPVVSGPDALAAVAMGTEVPFGLSFVEPAQGIRLPNETITESTVEN